MPKAKSEAERRKRAAYHQAWLAKQSPEWHEKWRLYKLQWNRDNAEYRRQYAREAYRKSRSNKIDHETRSD